MLSGMFVAPELTSGSDACNQDDWNAIMTQMKGCLLYTSETPDGIEHKKQYRI